MNSEIREKVKNLIKKKLITINNKVNVEENVTNFINVNILINLNISYILYIQSLFSALTTGILNVIKDLDIHKESIKEVNQVEEFRFIEKRK